MPRPAPQAAIHDLARPPVSDESVHLRVGDEFQATAARPMTNATHASHCTPAPGRVTATYTGSIPRNTCTVGMRWIANRSATNSHLPARSLSIG